MSFGILKIYAANRGVHIGDGARFSLPPVVWVFMRKDFDMVEKTSDKESFTLNKWVIGEIKVCFLMKNKFGLFDFNFLVFVDNFIENI